MFDSENYHRQRINKDFGGDEEKYEEYFRQRNHNAIYWGDLVNAETVLPDISDIAQYCIKKLLGYIPHEETLIKFEPAVRAVVNLRMMGTIDNADDFYDRLEEQIKPIRNHDMIPISERFMSEEKQKFYYDNFQPYGQLIRDRLTYLLGYEPRLEHSMDVELNMRRVIKENFDIFTGDVTAPDYKAIVSVKYREILVEEGIAAANASPLIGPYIRGQFGQQPRH